MSAGVKAAIVAAGFIAADVVGWVLLTAAGPSLTAWIAHNMTIIGGW